MSELSFKIDVFEGPLDLLLHLISKNKVSICDIPISMITDQYFEYIELMQQLDMEVGGEFLYLCSGPCHRMIRQTGANVGVCMYLAVQNYGPFDPSLQPKLSDIKLIRDHMMF